MKGMNKIRRAAKTRRGFTLIEMVTAAAIFSLLGVMLFTMVRSGMSMWNRGEDSRNEVDRAVLVLEAIARELRLTFSENEPLSQAAHVRFLCDFIDYDRDGDGVKEGRVQRLRFVRQNLEERENAAMQQAGDLPLGDHGGAYTTLFHRPDAESLPTGGLAEAVFMSYPAAKSAQGADANLALYRGYRTPIGGEDSYFSRGNLLREADIRSSLFILLEGVLYLEFRFWNQETQTFRTEDPDPLLRESAGFTWDSTRALISDEGSGPNRFPYYLGRASLEDVTDDIFPSRARITVVVTDPRGSDRPARLTARIKEEDLRIPLDVIKPFEVSETIGPYVRINEEWLEYSGVEGGELVVVRRGIRHTRPAEHKAGSLVYRGRTYSTVVEIAAGKECWNDAR